MALLRRTRPLLPVLLLALLAACGVEAGDAAPQGAGAPKATTTAPSTDQPTTTAKGDEPDGTTTEPDEPTTTTEPKERSEIEEQTIGTIEDTYLDLGMKPESARCLAEAIFDAQVAGDTPDQADVMGLMTDCGLTQADLLDLTETMGSNPDEVMTNSLVAAFKNQGLSEEDATCVAEAYIDEYGAQDTTTVQDAGAMIELFETCGLDETDLGG